MVRGDTVEGEMTYTRINNLAHSVHVIMAIVESANVLCTSSAISHYRPIVAY